MLLPLLSFAFLMSPPPSFSSCQTSDLNMFSLTLAQQAPKPGQGSSSTGAHRREAQEGLKHLLSQQTHRTVQAQSQQEQTCRGTKRVKICLFLSIKAPGLPRHSHLTAEPQQYRRVSILLLQPFLTGPPMSPGDFQLQTERSHLQPLFLILSL